MADESIHMKLNRADEMFAKAEVNLKGARMQLDDIARMLGFSKAHLPALGETGHGKGEAPYPQLTEEALSGTVHHAADKL